MSSRRAVHHYDRAQVADLIHPDNGYRGTMKRLGKTPKDHMKENRMELAELQARKREEKEENMRPDKVPYKLSQFKDIQSRVFNQLPENEEMTERNVFLHKNVSAMRQHERAMNNRIERQVM
jgi:hypothetical protein